MSSSVQVTTQREPPKLARNPENRLTRRMAIVTNEEMRVISRQSTRRPHIPNPSSQLPTRPQLRDVSNANRIRPRKELQIRGLLALAHALVYSHVAIGARLDLRPLLPVGPANLAAQLVESEHGRGGAVGVPGLVVGWGSKFVVGVETDGDADDRVALILGLIGGFGGGEEGHGSYAGFDEDDSCHC